MNEVLDNQIPKEFCPFCSQNLIRPLSEEEQRKYNHQHPYVKQKVGLSNWDSIFAWKCPFCLKFWKR